MGKCVSKHNVAEEESSHFNFAGGNVHVVTTEAEWKEKLSEASGAGKIVVANFSASWCGPCKIMAPYYSELSEKYPFLMFLIIDVDELIDLSTSYDIKATPSIFFLKDGEQFDKLVGCNKPELEKKVIAIADSHPPPHLKESPPSLGHSVVHY